MRVLNKRDQFTEMNKKEDEYARGVLSISPWKVVGGVGQEG